MARIVIRHLTGSKANEIEEFPLQDFTELTLGRDPSSMIQYDASRDDLVSRNHAKIMRDGHEGGQFSITDLGSSNGTYVDKVKINGPTRLAHGSRIQLGINGPEFRFELDPPPQTSLLTRLGQVDSPEPRTDILPPLTGPGRTSRRTGFTSVSEGAGRGVGAGTVERMIDERLVATTKHSRHALINSIASGLGVVVLGIGIFVYLQRMPHPDDRLISASSSSTTGALQEGQSLPQQPPIESMPAGQIVNIYSAATVHIETNWKLVGKGGQLYHRYSPPYTFFLLNGDMELHRNR
jgi:hypothetical protein